MIDTGIRMLISSRLRFAITAAGIGVLFFSRPLKSGCSSGGATPRRPSSGIQNADLWVMARQTPAFDYGTPIPEHRAYQVRNIAGVASTELMFLGWSIWQCPDGRRVNVEIVGLDETCNGGPWEMQRGTADRALMPDAVIVDQLFLDDLGVRSVGDQVEIFSSRAVVRGVSREVRSFTASPFVFTSIETARQCSPHYKRDEITYVLVKCAPGRSPIDIKNAIEQQVPHIECLTSREFMLRTIEYWMLETGAGLTVIGTAVLGFLVSAVVISQTLYSITQEHLLHYATLLALGFRRRQLVGIVVLQSGFLGVLGVIGGSVLFFATADQLSDSPIRLETSVLLYTVLVMISLMCCLSASLFSIQNVLRLDPADVFRS